MRTLTSKEYQDFLNVFNIRYRNSRKNRLLIEFIYTTNSSIIAICNLKWSNLKDFQISKEFENRLFIYKKECIKSNYIFATNKGLKPSRITIYEMLSNYSKKAGIDNLFKNNKEIKEESNMTIRQIAETAGCGINTVRRIGKMKFPEVKNNNNGRAIEYSESQSIAIMDKLPKSNYVADPTQMGNQTDKVDYEAIGKMIAIAVSSAMAPLINQLQNTTPQPTQLAISEKSVLEFPPVPDISPRKLLNQLVYKYSMSMNIEPQEGWHELHNQFFLRCNDNVSLKARNRNMSVIDFLEKENKLLMGCSIMKELIG